MNRHFGARSPDVDGVKAQVAAAAARTDLLRDRVETIGAASTEILAKVQASMPRTRRRYLLTKALRFEAAYERLQYRIIRQSKRERVPGMDADDVRSEMQLTLWHAWQTHDRERGLTLEQWWAVCWCRRRVGLLRPQLAAKRPVECPVAPDDLAATLDRPMEIDEIPDCPLAGPLHRLIWLMLAIGYRPSDVQERLDLSRRAYYSLLHDYRRDDVRAALVGGGGRGTVSEQPAYLVGSAV